MGRKIVLEGKVYSIVSCDCWCFVLLDKDPTLNELIENYRREYGRDPGELDIEEMKSLLDEHIIKCRLWRRDRCLAEVDPRCVEAILDSLRGRRVRITIEVME